VGNSVEKKFRDENVKLDQIVRFFVDFTGFISRFKIRHVTSLAILR